MSEIQRKSKVEITDLISKAVSHATARRNSVVDAEEPLSLLSDEQVASIKGGLTPLKPPIVMGIIYVPTCEL